MRRKNTIWIIFAIVLVDALGIGILIPIIPLLFTDPEYQYHLMIPQSTGYLLLGALTALYPFMQFIGTPILGQISDTFGRRPVLAFSLFGTALSYVLFAIGIIFRNIPLLFAARLLDGITGSNVAVAQAVVADTTASEDRVHRFGLLGAANGIGFILGPLAGGILSDSHILRIFSAPTPFWFAAGLSFLNMAAVLIFLPETLRTKTKNRLLFGQSFKNIKQAATGLGKRSLYATSFLFQSGFAFIITFFGVYLVSRFDFSQSQIGYLFAFVGVTLALTQIFITGPLSRHVRSTHIISVGLIGMSASLAGVYFAHNVYLLYALTAPTALFAGLALTNLTGLISTSSKNKEQGSVLGINSSVQSLAQSIPPLFAGVIAALLAPTTPILFAAIIIAIAALFFVLTHRDEIDIATPLSL